MKSLRSNFLKFVKCQKTLIDALKKKIESLEFQLSAPRIYTLQQFEDNTVGLVPVVTDNLTVVQSTENTSSSLNQQATDDNGTPLINNKIEEKEPTA